MKPYKPQISQELKDVDDIKRLAFCQKIEEWIESGELDPMKIIFTDKSHVYLKSTPSKQNICEWSLSKPENRSSIPIHTTKVRVDFDESFWPALF